MSEARAVPNLLRPQQVKDHKDDIAKLNHQLTQPHLQNPGLVQHQIRGLQKTLDEFAPVEFKDAEMDTAVKREAELREAIVSDGMPTQAEMRRNPHGAVNKHLQFEKRNKPKINEWRYLRRRLFAGSDDPDVSNFEQFRPAGGAQELAMDGAQIPGKDIHIPAVNPTVGAIMSVEEGNRLKELDPELRRAMATLDGEARAKVLGLVRQIIAEEAAADEIVQNVSPLAQGPVEMTHGEKVKAGKAKAAAKRAAEARQPSTGI